MKNSSISSDIHDFIRHLLSSLAAAGLYGMEHRQVGRLLDTAHSSLVRALAIRPDISMLEVDGEIVIDNEPQPFSLVLDKFAQYLRENSIGHLRFLAGVLQIELETFVATLATHRTSSATGSTEHIRVGRLEMPEQGGEAGSLGAGGSGDGAKAIELVDIPGVELARLAEVYEAVKRKERLKPSGIAATVAELLEAFKCEGESMLVLAAIREQDEYTFTHSANVCILTIAQTMSLGIGGKLLNDIGVASMLHDVGKMFIPDEILLKPGRLTDEEYGIMKQHTVKGSRYLLESPGITQLAAIVAYEHHMNMDLSGYPTAPAGWQPNFASQVTAISDICDAMRTRRPYKEPKCMEEILNMLTLMSKSEMNPVLVDNFINIMTRARKTDANPPSSSSYHHT